MPQDNKLLLKSLRKKHKNLMNQAYKLDLNEKERRKLILVARETPYNLIHIENMKKITNSGGIICPATPSFYSKPKNFEELAATVIDRVINLAEIKHDHYMWGEQ